MKYFNRLTLFFAFILFNHEIDMFSYTYTITNDTNSDLKVQLFSAVYRPSHAKLNEEPTLIKSRKKYKFSFKRLKSILCLYKIAVFKNEWGKNRWGKDNWKGIVLYNSPLFGEVKKSGLPIWLSTCGNRNYILSESLSTVKAINQAASDDYREEAVYIGWMEPLGLRYLNQIED